MPLRFGTSKPGDTRWLGKKIGKNLSGAFTALGAVSDAANMEALNGAIDGTNVDGTALTQGAPTVQAEAPASPASPQKAPIPSKWNQFWGRDSYNKIINYNRGLDSAQAEYANKLNLQNNNFENSMSLADLKFQHDNQLAEAENARKQAALDEYHRQVGEAYATSGVQLPGIDASPVVPFSPATSDKRNGSLINILAGEKAIKEQGLLDAASQGLLNNTVNNRLRSAFESNPNLVPPGKMIDMKVEQGLKLKDLQAPVTVGANNWVLKNDGTKEFLSGNRQVTSQEPIVLGGETYGTAPVVRTEPAEINRFNAEGQREVGVIPGFNKANPQANPQPAPQQEAPVAAERLSPMQGYSSVISLAVDDSELKSAIQQISSDPSLDNKSKIALLNQAMQQAAKLKAGKKK